MEGIHPSDYALFLFGLPKDATDEAEIVQFFEENAVKDENIKGKIIKVVIGYDVREFRALALRKLQLTREKEGKSDEEKEALDAEIELINKKFDSVAGGEDHRCLFDPRGYCPNL